MNITISIPNENQPEPGIQAKPVRVRPVLHDVVVGLIRFDVPVTGVFNYTGRMR